ncbi:hypothetical protein AO1008_00508 [Aspergillus oryzae 100-8]|uniref:Uncharacterized protein n=1 Tax=Aspergillus oryzae (strain 3.042) TaxID=1160506 RepID=I8IAX4_ASPO3|nr:hypothetical protein Ao3042_09421 [Aspergillus oryzae 3.042]KDE85143.1 hypothetical protein AO1008_00508 [Aspergillus oryzae 100-8]|eukprot:EIT74586.1 hypothetical protein Ao3042_09421 [Aspergillus oryzae 3.042]
MLLMNSPVKVHLEYVNNYLKIGSRIASYILATDLKRHNRWVHPECFSHSLQGCFVCLFYRTIINHTTSCESFRKSIIDVIPGYTSRSSKEKPVLVISDIATEQDLPLLRRFHDCNVLNRSAVAEPLSLSIYYAGSKYVTSHSVLLCGVNNCDIRSKTLFSRLATVSLYAPN